MVLVQKWSFSNLFFLGYIGKKNVFYDILKRKNDFLGYKNRKLKKSNLFFLGNIGKENVFYDILERKNAFVGYKNWKFKKSKNWHFPKGLTHGFGPKMAIFPTFFLGNIGQENVFYDILERKNVFLGYKNKKFTKSKN